MSWRPEDWGNPYQKPIRDGVSWNKEVQQAYEAGADAILKALETYNIKRYGRWVFIPKEKDNVAI